MQKPHLLTNIEFSYNLGGFFRPLREKKCEIGAFLHFFC